MSFEILAGKNSDPAATAPADGTNNVTGRPSFIAIWRGLLNIALRRTLAVVSIANPDDTAWAVSAAPDYTASDCMGGIGKFKNAMAAVGGFAMLETIVLHDAAAQAIAGTIVFFDALPVGGAYVDNGALALSAADLTHIVAKQAITAGDWAVVPGGGGPTRAEIVVGRIVHSAAASKDLYALLMVTTTPNMAATTDIRINAKFTRW